MRRTRGGIAYFTGGSGDHLLLLLHGLGATAAVWRRLLRWWRSRGTGGGRLRICGSRAVGRGAALRFRRPRGGRAELAAELGAGRVTVLGHSFGGVVGASWERPVRRARRPRRRRRRQDGLDDDEVARAQAMSRRPPQVFASSLEAADRHLKLAGLRDLVDPADPVALAGVRIAHGGWIAALDPRAFGAVTSSVETVLSRSAAPLRLAAGSADPMVGPDSMRRVDPDAVLLDAAGHNAHWESPEAVWKLLGP